MNRRFSLSYLASVAVATGVGALCLFPARAGLPAQGDLVSPFALRPPRFAIQSIGLLPGGNSSIALALNEAGQVVGSATTPSRNAVPIFWEPDITRAPRDWITRMDGLVLTNSSDESVGHAFAINDAGQAVGRIAQNNLTPQAFVWEKNKGIRTLGALESGQNSVARAINDSGQIVGYSGNNARRRAFLYELNADTPRMTALGIPDKNYWCQAFAISNKGTIVGEADSFDKTIPFATELAEPDGHDPEHLGTAGQQLTTQISVNGVQTGVLGRIVRAPHGFVWFPEPADAATLARQTEREAAQKADSVRYAAGSFVSVGHLGGGYAGALGISPNWVCGVSRAKTGENRAILWNARTRKMSSLGTLGGKASLAWSVNTNGATVGWARDGQNRQRAFLYLFTTETTGKTHDLNDLLAGGGAQWTLTDARDINERGQIVGRGFYRDPQTNVTTEQGFILTPLSP